MTPEELAQIQTIIQSAVTAAVTPIEQGQQQINTRLDTLEQGQQNLTKQITEAESRLETKISALETKVSTTEIKIEKSEKNILTKLDQLEKLSADYLDGRVQTVTRRVDRIEKHLNLTP